MFNTKDRKAEVTVSSDTFDRIYAIIGTIGVCTFPPQTNGYAVNLKALRILLDSNTPCTTFYSPKESVMKNIISAFSSEFKKVKQKVSDNLDEIDLLLIKE